MGGSYKLDMHGFNSGVNKTLTMKPMVRVLKNIKDGHGTSSVNRDTKKGNSVVIRERRSGSS